MIEGIIVLVEEGTLFVADCLLRGRKTTFLPIQLNSYVLSRPLWKALLSYVHGWPRRTSHTSISRTSQTIQSWYRFPMDNDIVHIALTAVSPFFVIQFTL